MPAAQHNALHQPVLLEACLELLGPACRADGAVLIDATLGMGGHSQAFLDAFPKLQVIGIDRDPQAIELAQERLAEYRRFTAVHSTYDSIPEVARHYGVSGNVAAILMDLGVSSWQLDRPERGFSYSQDAPLDMRMDGTATVSAAELVNTASTAELARILHEYGEEKFASRIARRIVQYREQQPLQTTGELAELVKDAIPAPARRTGGNPTKRTFQALRIAVNAELDILAAALPRAIAELKVGGRIAVESYHSLEDRLVKSAFAQGINSSTPAGLPVELESHQPYLRALTRGAQKASTDEIAENPRSASVRLRAVERIRPTPAHLLNSENNVTPMHTKGRNK
ncbi:MAG: 16S rRNA (cytosine(1402)-N(4))-methyltransferase RsmH [Trueperella sp.]|nr:16S rRNA (cytosine(1402)-N(4))-methyltransferase RsmH [Trueperella sp.]